MTQTKRGLLQALKQVDDGLTHGLTPTRQSAARSKLKGKLMMESLKAKHELLAGHRERCILELQRLQRLCGELEGSNLGLLSKIQVCVLCG